VSWSQNQVAFYLIFHEVIFFLAITIMPQISAPGAYLILEDPGWALISKYIDIIMNENIFRKFPIYFD